MPLPVDDEMFTDAVAVQDVDDVVFEVDCKVRPKDAIIKSIPPMKTLNCLPERR